MRRREQPDHTESTALPAIQNRATNSTDSRYQDRSFARMGHSSSNVTETVYRHQIRPVITVGAEAMDKIFATSIDLPRASGLGSVITAAVFWPGLPGRDGCWLGGELGG